MENIQKEISNLVQTILVDLKNKNLTGYEISANLNSGLSTNVRLGKVETIEFNKDKSINITVYNGQKKGHVSITDFTKTTLRNAIDTACRIATYTEEDPYSGLIDTEYLAKDILDLDLYHPSSLTPDQAIETAIICEQAGLDYSEKIINSEGASCNINESFRVYANSNNFFGKVNSTSHSISCVLVGKQGDNLERDYDFSVARDYNDLIDQKKLGKMQQ